MSWGNESSVPGQLQLNPKAGCRGPTPQPLAVQRPLQRNLTPSRGTSANLEASWFPSQFAEKAKAPFKADIELHTSSLGEGGGLFHKQSILLLHIHPVKGRDVQPSACCSWDTTWGSEGPLPIHLSIYKSPERLGNYPAVQNERKTAECTVGGGGISEKLTFDASPSLHSPSWGQPWRVTSPHGAGIQGKDTPGVYDELRI